MPEPMNTVLAVDLDGTLIRTDSLLESLLLLARRQPWTLLKMPLWLLKGRASFKERLSALAIPDARLLPYHREFLDWLKQEHARGRAMLLITASHQRIADAVADHLGIFSQAIGSSGGKNLKGAAKLELLRKNYGDAFVYAGNSAVDLPIWRGSPSAILVNAPTSVRVAAAKHTSIERVFASEHRYALELLRALRPHQWLKNLLIFVPIFTSHRLETDILLEGFIAFVAFSLCASAGYLFNDLLDLPEDRAHPRKRHRSIAAGNLPVPLALTALPILLLLSVALALELPATFLMILLVYLIATVAYSLRIKRIPMLDVLFLAMLYTLRIIAGTVATGVDYSAWLLAFSMFLFLSLALLKRTSELLLMRREEKESAAGRGYVCEDSVLLSQFGTASGYLSVFVFALYVSSEHVTALYGHPDLLWLICPVLLYFISRMWFITHHGRMHDDPILFAIRDPVSLVLGACTVAIAILAIG